MAEFPVKTLVSLYFFFLFSHSAPPLFFQTQTACEMHHCQATACQNRSVFGKSEIRLKCKHQKTHPCPLHSTTQSLKNSLMIKADWEILHQFQKCFQIFQLQALTLPPWLPFDHRAPSPGHREPPGSSSTGSVCRIINNSGHPATDFKTRPGLQAQIYTASKSSSTVYCFTITTWVSLNWQAEKGFEICFPKSKKKRVEWGVQNNSRERNEKKNPFF